MSDDVGGLLVPDNIAEAIVDPDGPAALLLRVDSYIECGRRQQMLQEILRITETQGGLHAFWVAGHHAVPFGGGRRRVRPSHSPF